MIVGKENRIIIRVCPESLSHVLDQKTSSSRLFFKTAESWSGCSSKLRLPQTEELSSLPAITGKVPVCGKSTWFARFPKGVSALCLPQYWYLWQGSSVPAYPWFCHPMRGLILSLISFIYYCCNALFKSLERLERQKKLTWILGWHTQQGRQSLNMCRNQSGSLVLGI